MKFHRVYVELSNICGLKCSFCPQSTLKPQSMSLDFFESLLAQLLAYTKEIAYHMGGDPLSLSNLEAYLDATKRYGLQGLLTTSGYYLSKHSHETLLHPALKQVNISLNSYNKNAMPLSFEAYMQPVLELCRAQNETRKDLFINLRVWNFDEKQSEKAFNAMLFAYLSQAFGVTLDAQTIERERPRSLRLAEKVLVHFDRYFEWPSLASKNESEGTCLGLKSHFGILSSGIVVPCCLDKEGVIPLGNLHVDSLETILNAQRAQTILQGFRQGRCVETLCRKCTYKHRFQKDEQ